MAKTVSSLNVKLTLTTRKFVRGLRGAIKSVRRFGQRLVRNSLRVAKWGAALGTAALSGGLFLFIRSMRQAMEEIDNLAKTSRKLGIPIRELAGLQLAAKVSGVELRQVNLGIQRMVRRMAEAASGGGEAKQVIKELGIDAKRFINLPFRESLLELADAFSKVQNPAERIRKGFKLFDSEGVALINTLGLGRKELERFFSIAEKVGIVNERQAAMVEKANDAWTVFRFALSGIRQQVAVSIAPAIRVLGERMSDLASRAKITASGIASAFQSMTEAVAMMVDTVKLLGPALEQSLAHAMRNFARFLDAIQQTQLVLGDPVLRILEGLPGTAGQSIKVARAAMQQASFFGQDRLRELADELDRSANTFLNDAIKEQEGLTSKVRSFFQSLINEIKDAAKDMADAVDNATTVPDSLAKGLGIQFRPVTAEQLGLGRTGVSRGVVRVEQNRTNKILQSIAQATQQTAKNTSGRGRTP